MIIYCTVTNDLTYDQRMIRICSSLVAAGYSVTLVGRKMKKSVALSNRPFRQKRLDCFFNKGKLFYAEFNLRLFFFLLFKRMDCICVIDLDTILPGYFISKLRGIKKAYDAHELFCEMKEVVTRPAVYRAWKKIEKITVPVFKHGYTVNEEISNEFKRMYAVKYEVIRSVPLLTELQIPLKKEKYILYQGALNEGRCFETLIPAMKYINVPLVICGEGNFSKQARLLVTEHGLREKIYFKGNIVPFKPQDEKLFTTLCAYIPGHWLSLDIRLRLARE